MELNRKTVRTIIYLITFTVLLNVVVHNLNDVKAWMLTTLGIMTPIIIGFAIAFIINIPVSLIEKNILKERKGKFFSILHRFRRPISIIVSFVSVIVLLSAIIGIVLPQFTAALTGAIAKLPPLVEQLRLYLTEYEDEAPELVQWLTSLKINWDTIKNYVNNIFKSGIVPAVNFVTTAATSVFGTATNLLLGSILAINILSIKEKLSKQLKSLIRAYIKPDRAERLIEIGQMAHGVFTSFIACQVTEALILAGLCYVGMLIFQFPYAFLISVVVGVTALVPIFGAWIATAIGAVLILTVEPIMALWFVIFFVILQQIEGNAIYPRVVGNQVGLPAMWVLISITIGGGVLGIVGMLLSVPTFAVVYMLLRESVKKRLQNNPAPNQLIEEKFVEETTAAKPFTTNENQMKGMSEQNAQRRTAKKRKKV